MENLLNIADIFNDNFSIIQLLIDSQIIQPNFQCPTCNKVCYIKSLSEFKEKIGYQCESKSRPRHKFSLKSTLKLYCPKTMTLFTFAYILFQSFPRGSNALEAFENNQILFGEYVSYKSILKIYKSLRSCIKNYWERYQDSYYLTGQVQVDETMWSHLDLRLFPNMNIYQRQIWIVGLVEETTQKAKIFFVRQRDSETLQNIIFESVTQGSRIHTDGWSGYLNIDWDELNMVHVRHIHSGNGLRTFEHSNLVEGMWGTLKRKIRKIYNVIPSESDENIDFIFEGMWRRELKRTQRDKRLDFLKETFQKIHTYQLY